MTYLKLDDSLRYASHVIRDVLNQPSLFVRLHQAEQIAGLSEIIVALIVAIYFAVDCVWQFAVTGIFHWPLKAIRFVVRRIPAVLIKPHEAVPIVRMNGTPGSLRWQSLEVYAQPITLSVLITDQP